MKKYAILRGETTGYIYAGKFDLSEAIWLELIAAYDTAEEAIACGKTIAAFEQVIFRDLTK